MPPSPYNWLPDLASAIGAFLGYRKRGLVLIPTVLLLPVAYLLALAATPGSAGTAAFTDEYDSFFQTAAQVIAAVLVASR